MTKRFESEAALCAAFIDWVGGYKTWTAYPETAGWDVLLVSKAGEQIGVQAKLTMNAAVLTQALENHYALLYDRQGPDYRAVLVPESRGFGQICDHLGITLIHAPTHAYSKRRMFEPALPTAKSIYPEQDWFDRCPTERCDVPQYVPDVPAGAPSPLQLTDWKIRAIKIAVLLEQRGYVTRADFAHIKINISRWLTMGWLKQHPDPAMRGAYVVHRPPDFKAQHPRNFGEIAADIEEWRPPQPGTEKGKK